jgi:hypothetical protein
MSESIVDASHVEEIVTQVLTQLVQDGGDEDQMSVELLQEQVELHLEYDSGSLSKWHNFLGRTLRDFFKSKNPASVHTALTWPCKAPEPVTGRDTRCAGYGVDEMAIEGIVSSAHSEDISPLA